MMDARTKRTFKFVFVVLLVDLLAFTLILPLLPKILDYYATNDESGSYRLFDENAKLLRKLLRVPESYDQVLLAGIIGSWFSFLQFLSSPILGALSDEFGRKSILSVAVIGSVFSYAMWFYASDSFSLFILSRTIGGLSKATVGIALAIVSDVSDGSVRGMGMAMIGSCFSLAFILGPLIGAYLSTLARSENQAQSQLITNPSLIALLLSLIEIILVVGFYEETNPTKKPFRAPRIQKQNRENNHAIAQSSPMSRALNYVNPRSLFEFNLIRNVNPPNLAIIRKTGLIYFSYLLFYSGLEFTLAFLTHTRFNFSSMDQGKLYLFSGILMSVVQGGYMRRCKGGRETTLAISGLIMIIPSFILMGLSRQVSHIYISLAMYAISSAIVVPCLTAIISNECSAESQGVALGTVRSIGALARAIGPCLASFIFWTFGAKFCYIGGATALIYPVYQMRKLQSSLRARDSHVTKVQQKSTKSLAKAS